MLNFIVMATISKENYLKSIYLLGREKGNLIGIADLSRELNVSKSAISDMATKLANQGYIDYQKYKGIKIITKGEKLAIDVLRKHRLWELFLIEILDLSWAEVHVEAEKLEHCTTKKLIDKIDEYLKYPKTDPHGEPIPNINGKFRVESNDFLMKNCLVNQSYQIVRVNDRSDDLMKYLTQINISLNKKVTVLERIEFDGSIIVEIDDARHMLSEKVLENIFVIQINKKK